MGAKINGQLTAINGGYEMEGENKRERVSRRALFTN